MSSGVKLSSAGPEDQNKNGLGPLLDDAITSPKSLHAVIGIVNTKTVTTDVDSGIDSPTLRFLHIEVVGVEHRDAAFAMLSQAFAARTGMEELPFEVEKEIRQSLGQNLKPDGTITEISRRRKR